MNNLVYHFTKADQLKNNIPQLLTGGNPYMAMNFFSELVKGKFIEISNGRGLISKKLVYILENEETILIDPPRCRIKVNGPLIDRLTCIQQLILKVASCIGEIFDIQTLNRINPFKQIINNKLLKLLEEIEQKDMIEVMEIQEYNIYYRFTFPFLRECIYHRMTHKQRRQTHLSVAEAIQTLPELIESEQANESRKLQFHWSFFENKWKLDIEPEQSKDINTINTWKKIFPILGSNNIPHVQNNDDPIHEPLASSKAIRSIILKQIQTKFGRNNNDPSTVIKEGYLDKKSDKNITWSERYCVLDGKELKYYYTEDDYIKNITPLSAITLKNLYQVEAVDEHKKNFVFFITATSWIKKNIDKGGRKFYFATMNIESLEEWIIYLEFAKAKAVYDDFVSHYGKISFPIGRQNDFFDLNYKFDVNMIKRIPYITKNDLKASINITPQRSSRASKFSMQLKSLKFLASYDEQSILAGQALSADIPLIKQRLASFLTRTMMLFYSHLFQMSLQCEDNLILFGQNTSCMRKILYVFKVNNHLLNQQQKKQSADSGASSNSETELSRKNNININMPLVGIIRKSSIRSQESQILENLGKLQQIVEEEEDKGDLSQNSSSEGNLSQSRRSKILSNSMTENIQQQNDNSQSDNLNSESELILQIGANDNNKQINSFQNRNDNRCFLNDQIYFENYQDQQISPVRCQNKQQNFIKLINIQTNKDFTDSQIQHNQYLKTKIDDGKLNQSYNGNSEIQQQSNQIGFNTKKQIVDNNNSINKEQASRTNKIFSNQVPKFQVSQKIILNSSNSSDRTTNMNQLNSINQNQSFIQSEIVNRQQQQTSNSSKIQLENDRVSKFYKQDMRQSTNRVKPIKGEDDDVSESVFSQYSQPHSTGLRQQNSLDAQSELIRREVYSALSQFFQDYTLIPKLKQ